MRTHRRAAHDPATLVVGFGVAAVGIGVPLLLWLMQTTSYEIWGGVLVAVALTLASVPLLYRVSSRHGRRIAQIVALAFVLKLAATVVRYYVAFDVYGGTADAGSYIQWGNDLVESFRQGVFSVDVGRGRFVGTGFMRYLSGLAFLLVGSSGLGAFFLFAWLSLFGIYGFFRAFQIAFPDADHSRYAALVFLLPTLLYWPSSIGKEAWMLLCLGVAAYGAAKVFVRQPGGYLPLTLGVAGTVMMRPHIAALLCLAVAAGYLRRRPRGRAPVLGPLPQVVGIALLVVATFMMIDRTQEFFQLDEPETLATSAESILELAQDRTAIGGSTFDTDGVRSPVDLPGAVMTVMYRPFPWEATNQQMVLTSIEAFALLGLTLLSWRRVWAGVKGAWSNPYLRFALVFVLGFVVAFASISNFGILARQRAQMYPLLLVFLAVSPVLRGAGPAAPTDVTTRTPTHG